jgi:flagellar biosynthesis protein FlhG
MSTARPAAARILSVGGGKGGVGKSVIAANLAVYVARSGAKTILVDADLGAANLHTLFDLRRAGRTLNELFTREIESLEEAAVEVGVPNLRLIAGSSATAGAANLNHAQKLKLVRQLQGLDADVVIIDVGAGISFNVVDLFNAADFRLLVITPQLTSVQNAYGFLKAAVFRVARQIASRSGWDSAFQSAGETQKLPEIIDSIRAQDREVGDALDQMLATFGAQVIGNQVFDINQRNTFYALSRMVHDFLGTPLPLLGALRASRVIHDSVNQRRPFALGSLAEENGRILSGIAAGLLREDPGPLRAVRQRLDRLGGARASAAEQADEQVTSADDAAPLPSPLKEYSRLPPRYPVAWRALVEVGASHFPVRVEDVSLAGARLSGAGSLEAEQRCEILFDGFAGRVSALVRYADGKDIAGVEFVEAGELPAQLVAAARAGEASGG